MVSVLLTAILRPESVLVTFDVERDQVRGSLQLFVSMFHRQHTNIADVLNNVALKCSQVGTAILQYIESCNVSHLLSKS